MAAASAAPPRGGPAGLPAKVTPISPNQTLYVRNIPSSRGLQKQDIRMALYMLFSTYGPVLDVVALKTTKMRGQAHVVFRDIHASTQAMRSLEDFDFFGCKLKIEYAKTKSNAISKLDGSFKLNNPSAPKNVQITELQQSIFNAPVPGAAAAAAAVAASASTATTAPHGLPNKPQSATQQAAAGAASSAENRGQKRNRDEEEEDEEEDSDVAMEEDSDED